MHIGGSPITLGRIGGPLFEILIGLVVAPFWLASFLLKVLILACAIIIGSIGQSLGIT